MSSQETDKDEKMAPSTQALVQNLGATSIDPPCPMCADTGVNALNNGEPCVCQISKRKD